MLSCLNSSGTLHIGQSILGFYQVEGSQYKVMGFEH
jgi:hypothetical protein